MYRNTIHNDQLPNNDNLPSITEITIPTLDHNSSSQVYNQYTPQTSQPQRVK